MSATITTTFTINTSANGKSRHPPDVDFALDTPKRISFISANKSNLHDDVRLDGVHIRRILARHGLGKVSDENMSTIDKTQRRHDPTATYCCVVNMAARGSRPRGQLALGRLLVGWAGGGEDPIERAQTWPCPAVGHLSSERKWRCSAVLFGQSGRKGKGSHGFSKFTVILRSGHNLRSCSCH